MSEAGTSPDVVPTSPAPTAPVVENAPAVAAVIPSAAPATVESASPLPPEGKPVAEAPAADVLPAADAPTPEAPAETAPAAPVYQDFKLPEGFSAQPDQIKAYTDVLGKFAIPQEAGQALMDFHAAEVRKAVDAYKAQALTDQQEAFAKTRETWRNAVDKEFGTKRDQVVSDANWAINHLVTNKEHRKAIFEALALTGAGDHPAVIRAFAAAAPKLRERGAPPPSAPTKPILSAAERRYGRSNGASA